MAFFEKGYSHNEFLSRGSAILKLRTKAQFLELWASNDQISDSIPQLTIVPVTLETPPPPPPNGSDHNYMYLLGKSAVTNKTVVCPETQRTLFSWHQLVLPVNDLDNNGAAILHNVSAEMLLIKYTLLKVD